MPRALKPYDVSTVKHDASGVTVAIKLDRESKAFFGMVQGLRVEAETEAACRVAVLKRLAETARYEWRKIVAVETHDRFRGERQNSLHLAFAVHEVAPKIGDPGRWVERDEPSPWGGGDLLRPYHGKTAHSPSDGIYVLPWSEATVAALKDIQRRIDTLRLRLRDLVAADDAPARLAASVAGLLPAAPDAGGGAEDEE